MPKERIAGLGGGRMSRSQRKVKEQRVSDALGNVRVRGKYGMHDPDRSVRLHAKMIARNPTANARLMMEQERLLKHYVARRAHEKGFQRAAVAGAALGGAGIGGPAYHALAQRSEKMGRNRASVVPGPRRSGR